MFWRYRFTGKERDAESGLDFFGARYYASSTGRWMSPDWAEKPEAVPYSSLADPQSLNLYQFVRNNPLRNADPDGHACPPDCDPEHNAEQGEPEHLTALPEIKLGPRTEEVLNGVIGLGGVAVAAPEIGAAGVAAVAADSLLGTLAAGATAVGAAGTAVNATTQIAGGLSGTNTEDARDHVTTVTNPTAAIVGAASGSAHTGAQAADVVTVAGAGVGLAKTGTLKNPAETAGAMGGAIDATKSVVSGAVNYVKNFFKPSPPPPPTPPPPPQ